MSLDIEAIDARANAATPGPWKPLRSHISGAMTVIGNDDRGCVAIGLNHGVEHHIADGIFIAHARADVPALVAEVRRLKAALSDVAQAMANAEMILRSPDMGGQYLGRAREQLKRRMKAYEALR